MIYFNEPEFSKAEFGKYLIALCFATLLCLTAPQLAIAQGDTSQGDTSQGGTGQSNTSQSNTSQGGTGQGKTSQSNTNQENTKTDKISPHSMSRYETATILDSSGTEIDIDYAVVLPANWDTTKAYPTLLAFPPGNQTRDMVYAGLEGYWAEEAALRNWVVISPETPNNKRFFEGNEVLIPSFLEAISEFYNLEGDKVHVGGLSNGGRSSFALAAAFPELIHSITAIPGFLNDDTIKAFEAIAHLAINMYVGESDTQWVNAMQETLALLKTAGAENVSFKIVEGQEHVIRNLSGATLFDWLETAHAQSMAAIERKD